MKLPLGRQTPAVHSFDRTNVMSLFPDQSGVSYLEINFPYIPFPYLILSKQILLIGVIQKKQKSNTGIAWIYPTNIKYMYSACQQYCIRFNKINVIFKIC